MDENVTQLPDNQDDWTVSDVDLSTEDVAKFKQYMSSEKRDMSYLMAFVRNEFDEDLDELKQSCDDVHVSDDLLSHGTLEIIDIYFSKYANLMLIWRTDTKDFTETEASFIHDYVVYDMEDFTSESDEWHKSIHKYLPESKKCLILSYDHPALELVKDKNYWTNLEFSTYFHALKIAEKIASGESDHDRLIQLFTKGPLELYRQNLDEVYKRRKK